MGLIRRTLALLNLCRESLKRRGQKTGSFFYERSFGSADEVGKSIAPGRIIQETFTQSSVPRFNGSLTEIKPLAWSRTNSRKSGSALSFIT